MLGLIIAAPHASSKLSADNCSARRCTYHVLAFGGRHRFAGSVNTPISPIDLSHSTRRSKIYFDYSIISRVLGRASVVSGMVLFDVYLRPSMKQGFKKC